MVSAAAPMVTGEAADRIIRRGLGIRPPFHVADGITWGQLFFGGAGYKAVRQVAIQEPPTMGWGTAFVLDTGDPRRVRVFHLWSMLSWVVPRDAYEVFTFQNIPAHAEFPRENFVNSLPRYYAEHRRRVTPGADFATCIKIMEALGVRVPTDEELGEVSPIPIPAKAVVEHKPAPAKRADGSGAFRPVKRDGRRGEVLAFFLDKGGTGSIDEAMKQFSITRSNLLSQLFLLRREHGVGYSVSGDSASVQLPEGIEEPFK
jgi:hypothetical protein